MRRFNKCKYVLRSTTINTRIDVRTKLMTGHKHLTLWMKRDRGCCKTNKASPPCSHQRQEKALFSTKPRPRKKIKNKCWLLTSEHRFTYSLSLWLKQKARIVSASVAVLVIHCSRLVALVGSGTTWCRPYYLSKGSTIANKFRCRKTGVSSHVYA